MEIDQFSIISLFNKRKTLGEEERRFLTDVFAAKELEGDETVLKKGSICNHIYFIESGALTNCFLDHHSKQMISGIATVNNFCTSAASFIHQARSTEFIRTIEKTKLNYINFRNFRRLIEAYPVCKDIYIKFREEDLSFMTRRIESVLLMTAKQRCESLLKIYPKTFYPHQKQRYGRIWACLPQH